MKLSDIAITAFFLFSQLPVSAQSLEGVFTKQAWAFFDAEYKLDDKQKLRSDIKKLLRGCAIYNYIYSQRNRNGN